MTPLVGLGVWVWELPLCDGGDVDKMVARAQRSGLSWVAVKATAGQVTRGLVEAFRAGGVECAAWVYSVPGVHETAGFVQTAQRLVDDCGIAHILIDAEIEWESIVSHSGKRVPYDRRPEAKVFCEQLRDAVGPDVYLADAPWPIVRAHPGFPWAEFGSIVDARMDQLYWMLAHDSFASFAARADDNWKQMPASPPRCPIGCMVDYAGATHAPLPELAAFLDRYKDAPARSLWSWQHLSSAEWMVLESRAGALSQAEGA